jgi:hypothetical protein
MPVPNEPFQCVSIDILGPFKPSKATGSIYVLVFICYMLNLYHCKTFVLLQLLRL